MRLLGRLVQEYLTFGFGCDPNAKSWELSDIIEPVLSDLALEGMVAVGDQGRMIGAIAVEQFDQQLQQLLLRLCQALKSEGRLQRQLGEPQPLSSITRLRLSDIVHYAGLGIDPAADRAHHSVSQLIQFTLVLPCNSRGMQYSTSAALPRPLDLWINRHARERFSLRQVAIVNMIQGNRSNLEHFTVESIPAALIQGSWMVATGIDFRREIHTHVSPLMEQLSGSSYWLLAGANAYKLSQAGLPSPAWN